MNVLVRVQHHPARAALVGPLLSRLPPGSEVVTDPNPDSPKRSPLRTYLEALRLPVADDVTHIVVVQDDAWPVDGFEEKMLDALATHPDELVCLFVPGSGSHRRQMLAAAARGQSFTRLATTWIPAVALSWPVSRAREFVEFADGRWDVEKVGGDDARIGSFCARRRARPWAVVPSIVEHPDVVESLIGKRNSAGRNRARVAAVI